MYLLQSEALKELEVTLPTFNDLAQEYGLEPIPFPGRKRYKYFLEEAIKLIKDNPADPQSVQRVREEIQRLQGTSQQQQVS